MKNQLRIIGGKFRSRKLSFPAIEGLRPSADRLRETLFNWLQFSIQDTVCLDAFAGSGALGFEALSRGAKQVVFLDESSEVIQQLKKNIQLLKLNLVNASNNCHPREGGDLKMLDSSVDSRLRGNDNSSEIHKMNALQFLQLTHKKFDLILLDPPFKKNLLNDCLRLIDERDLLTSDAKVYIESAADQPVDLSAWQVIKETNVGQVIGRLIIQRFDQI